MSKLPIDEIKEKVNLINYIENFYPEIKFTRDGGWVKSLCPFHDEDSPSFKIRIGSKTYKCFGCGAFGDVINFVKLKENINTTEACKLIGDNTGIPVNLEPPNPHHERYKDYFTAYAARYHNNLTQEEVPLNYFKERGIKEETIELFNLGYVPQDEYKNRSEFPLGNIGGRVSFPIYENKDYKYARVIGMGYRRLDDVKDNKYINDVNQEGRDAVYENGVLKKPAQDKNLAGVFIKGQCLYGYHLTHDNIKNERYAIIVEGYMDVLSLYQSGIKNVVGCMTADLTVSQISTLRALTDNVMLLLDGDKTGVSKMYKNIPKLYEAGFNVGMVVLDNNMDPADLCKTNDFKFEKIRSILSEKTTLAAISVMKPDLDAFDSMIRQQRESLENMLRKERIRILKKHRPMLEKITDKELREVFETELRTRLGMS